MEITPEQNEAFLEYYYRRDPYTRPAIPRPPGTEPIEHRPERSTDTSKGVGTMPTVTKVPHELRRERFDALERQKALMALKDKEDRAFRPEEEKEYKQLDLKIDNLAECIKRSEEDLERRRAHAAKEIEMLETGKKSHYLAVANEALRDVDETREFRNAAEMFFSLARLQRDRVPDPRLDLLREQREQVMGVGGLGGYAIPERFDAVIREVRASAAVVRPRATVLPVSDPPDSRLSFPCLDQRAEQNAYGGVQVWHGGEGTTLNETDAHLRQVSLEPGQLGAYITVSNKLLQNWQSCGTFITRMLATAMAAQEDRDCLTGNAVNQARGVLLSPATIAHNRATPGQISFGDCTNMLARLLQGQGGSPIWLANPSCIPQLASMVDAGSHAVWCGGGNLPGAQGGLPGTLLGYPLIFSPRVPALGSRADLSLLDLQFYVLLNGSGPFIASSEHIFFLSNRTVFRINWNFDADSWVSEPMPMEGAPTLTTSPFVVLQ